MELDTIIENAQNQGYSIEKGSEEFTIQTKRGEVEVIINEGEGQPRCYPFANQIYLFSDNENVVADLVHERDHFQIFPYDLIFFGVLWGSLITYSMYEVSQTNDLQSTLLTGAMELTAVGAHGLMGGVNLISDLIIYARERFGLNRR